MQTRSRSFWLLTIVALFSITQAQDAREALGPKDQAANNKTPHVLTQLMATKPAALKAELRGVHPRVYVTEAELKALRERARTTHRATWQSVLRNLRALQQAPPPAPAQARRAQNDVAIAIAETALAYKVEGDARYLDAAKKYMDAAVSYDIWGYANNKPNVDLAAGHLLYGLGWGYDLLYHELSEAERARYRDKLSKQARLLFEYYKPKPGRSYSYSQNHVFIPLAGLAVTAYALYDEVSDAPQWAALARAIYDRVLATYAPDGYYYEGFEYWIFSTPWLVHYLDAQAHATGEDLFDQPTMAGFRQMHLYVAHSLLPDGQYVFDFGDVFEGPLTRAKQGEEYARAVPGGRFNTNYNLLYRLAARFRDPEIQGVADWLKQLKHWNAEEFWTLLWQDPTLKAAPIARLPKSHYFRDHEVVYWRSDWTPQATAFAFKCGPPEGHHATALLKQFPDWHLSSGHAHPDAASFIIYANGKVLTGDAGYAGVPLTEHHNSVLIDGKGQAAEGKGHDAFEGYPYERLDQVRILAAQLSANSALIRADVTGAYAAGLGLTSFLRTFQFSQGRFEITDELSAKEPRVFTAMLHADERVEAVNERQFLLRNGGAALRVEVLTRQLSAHSEPNYLTAPGPPGAVDKGDRQQRGARLAIANARPVNTAQFKVRLTPPREK
ncbi:MAG: DUF4962 domain-containing protein [Acidobacteria bacterium]|nr:DUF4962 domain-containing protein [Acidobacteriota bacterium]MBI3427507.1 DUF4962 domain-containing protein [Acidobacteriota bacterium]